MRTNQQRAERDEQEAKPPAAATLPQTEAAALASRIGNQAFSALVQRQTPPATETPAAETPAAAADPAADARKLLEETPTSDVDYATWLIKAAEQGFANLMWNTPKELKALSEGTKIEGVEPSKTALTIPALETMHELTVGTMKRWTAAPTEAKKPVPFGSLIREGTSLHSGKAIDVSRTMDAASTAEVITYLGDLSPARYGIGLPFSGEYFDPADELEAKKAASEAAAKGAAPAPDAGAPKEGASAPAATPTAVTGALQLDTSGIYGVEWDPAAKAWGKPVVETYDVAYTKIKSKELKDHFQKMRDAGSTLIIFPDRKGHIHIDRRS